MIRAASPVITIDNAARLNALNTPVMTELIAVVTSRLGADETLRCRRVARRRRNARLHRRAPTLTRWPVSTPCRRAPSATLVHLQLRRVPPHAGAGDPRASGLCVRRRRGGCGRLRHARGRSPDAQFGAAGGCGLACPAIGGRGSALLPQLIRLGALAAMAADRRHDQRGDRAYLQGLVEEIAPAGTTNAAVERLLRNQSWCPILVADPFAKAADHSRGRTCRCATQMPARHQALSLPHAEEGEEPRRMMQDFTLDRRRRAPAC